jgi:hypothetical protein
MGKTLRNILLPTLVVASLFLGNNNNNNNNNNTPEETPAQIENMSIEEMLRNDSHNKRDNLTIKEIALQTFENEKYLDKKIKHKLSMNNEEYLQNKINEFAKHSEHFYDKKDQKELIYDTSELSLCQLQKIYLIYEYLKDSSNRKKIGKIIEADLLDPYAEHGGIIKFKKDKIYFKELESALDKREITIFIEFQKKDILNPR